MKREGFRIGRGRESEKGSSHLQVVVRVKRLELEVVVKARVVVGVG